MKELENEKENAGLAGSCLFKEQIEYMKKEQCLNIKISAAAARKEQAAWNMMEHNEIYGLAPLDYYYFNDAVCFRYDVSFYRQLSGLSEKIKGNFELIFFLCREVFFILDRASEYFLKEENFLLRPEWMFGDLFQKKVVLCYLPGREKQEKREALCFLEFIMEHMEHNDRQMVEFIYALYERVSEPHTPAEEILDFLDTWKSGTKKIPVEKDKKSDREKIWTLGREKESDICIPFMTVSRKHLQIVQNKEGCFVMDLSSTNGTRLNGKQLLPMQRVKCEKNDTLCVGGLSFSLQIASEGIRLCDASVYSNRIWKALQADKV